MRHNKRINADPGLARSGFLNANLNNTRHFDEPTRALGRLCADRSASLPNMVDKQWEEFLDPSVMRPRLITAAVYIASFELLKDRLIGRIREFMILPHEDHEQYKADVLSRNRSPVYASLDWLLEMGAVSEADIATFGKIKDCRNELAHELLDLIGTSGLPSELPTRYNEMVALLRKVETWWIKEVDIPTNSDFDGREVADADILPGPVAGLQLLRDVALGSEQESRGHLRALWRAQNHRDA